MLAKRKQEAIKRHRLATRLKILAIREAHFLLDLLKGMATKDEAKAHDNALAGTIRIAMIKLVDTIGDRRNTGQVYLVAIKKGQIHDKCSFIAELR